MGQQTEDSGQTADGRFDKIRQALLILPNPLFQK